MSFMPIYGGQRPAGLLDGYSFLGQQAPSAAPSGPPQDRSRAYTRGSSAY